MSWAYLRWYTHTAAAFLYAAYAAGCPRLLHSIVSQHSPLQYIPCSYPRFLVFIPLLSTGGIANYSDLPHKKKEKRGGGQPGHTVRLVLRSSFFSSPLLYFCTSPHGLSSFTFLYLRTSPYLLFRTLCPGLSTGTSSLLFWLLYTFSFFKIFLMRSSCFTFRTLISPPISPPSTPITTNF